MPEHDNHPHVHDTPDIGSISSGSTNSRLKGLPVNIATFNEVYDLWCLGLSGHIEFRPWPNPSHKDDEGVKAACRKRRRSFAINPSTKPAINAYLRSCALDPELLHAGMYMGVCPRNTNLHWDRELRIWVGGRNRDVDFYPGVVYDLDDHKAEDAISLSHGAEMIRELALKGVVPTLRVQSGSGRGEHGYIRYMNPVDKATGNRIARKMARLLHSDMQIADPARVLRVPGTWNSKSGDAVPVILFDVTGELYDAVEVETAIDLVARENGIDLSEVDYTSRAMVHSVEADMWPSVTIEEARRIIENCPRMAYYTTPAGAATMNYTDWFAMATWLHSLTPNDSSLFHEYSKLDMNQYSPRDCDEKWDNVADTKPVSCQWIQAQRPLQQCASCRFFKRTREEGEWV